jgi:hypothetical protein
VTITAVTETPIRAAAITAATELSASDLIGTTLEATCKTGVGTIATEIDSEDASLR